MLPRAPWLRSRPQRGSPPEVVGNTRVLLRTQAGRLHPQAVPENKVRGKKPAGFGFYRGHGSGHARKPRWRETRQLPGEGVGLEMAAFGGRDFTELGRSFCAIGTRQGPEFRVSLPVGITVVNLFF